MESEVQKKIINLLESNGAVVTKVIVANSSGTSDLIVCFKGHYVSIEVKDKNEKLKELQVYKQNQIKEAGGIAFSAWSVDDVVNSFKENNLQLTLKKKNNNVKLMFINDL